MGFIPIQHKMTIEVNFISEKIDIWSSPTHNSIIELSNSNQHPWNLCALCVCRPASIPYLCEFKYEVHKIQQVHGPQSPKAPWGFQGSKGQERNARSNIFNDKRCIIYFNS